MFNHHRLLLERAPSYQLTRSTVLPRSPLPINENKHTIAFALDIDGVLVRSKDALPGATKALAFLQQHDIPFIFLTNGGGKTEKDHVALLAERLDLQFDENQFVQSHTPFRDLVPELKNKNILVLGGTGKCIREVAHAYGFNSVYTSSDIYKAFPTIYPFAEITSEYHRVNGGKPLKVNEDGQFQISATLVWSSPRDWGMDLQLMMDLMLSHKGFLITTSHLNGDESLPNNGYAQGAFRAALQGFWLSHTGCDKLPNENTVGKPTRATYLYGERTLVDYHRKIVGEHDPQIRTIYMIGDNPASDIQGAIAFNSPRGIQWKSILVESGIHRAGEIPTHLPDYIVPGVQEAIMLALRNEMPELFVGCPLTDRSGLGATNSENANENQEDLD